MAMKWRRENSDVDYLLSEYLDGQLEPARAAEIERCMADDPQLGRELQRYAALDKRLQPADEAALAGIDYAAQRADIIAAIERKVLLDGQPRRRAVLRPIFRTLAAAAVLLIVASAAWLVQRPAGRAEISVALLGGPPVMAGQMELAVEMKRLEAASLAAMTPPAPPGEAPPGTVVVSIGSVGQGTDGPFPMEMLGVY